MSATDTATEHAWLRLEQAERATLPTAARVLTFKAPAQVAPAVPEALQHARNGWVRCRRCKATCSVARVGTRPVKWTCACGSQNISPNRVPR